MKYQTILFDLDGTLTDPGIGITNSFMYALEKYNIKVKDRSELYPLIGPPLPVSFSEHFGFDEQKCKEAIAYYREYYREKGLFENEVYKGIEGVLQRLQDAGCQLAVATSKPEHFAKQILEYFHLADYFTVIAGSNMDESRAEKAEVIQYCLEQLGVNDKSQVLMIGDRKYDVIGGHACDLKVMGVLFGYGNEKEFIEAGADYIVPTVNAIAEFVLSK